MTSNKTYLERLIALRDIGFPLAKQKEKEGALNLNIFMSDCGTQGCLLGWWATTDYAQARGWQIDNLGTPHYLGNMVDSEEEFFGITSGQWRKLFGAERFGSLNDRLAYLNTLIAERAAQEEAQQTSIEEEVS